MARYKKFYGWKVVAALWVIIFVNLAFTNYGAGVINAFMVKDLELDRSTLGLGFSVFALTQGFSAPIIARIVNSIGTRLTLFYGSLTIACGALLLATWVNQGWQYVVAFGLVTGLGCGLGTVIPAQTSVTLWFEKKRAFALSLVLAATGVGGFVAAPMLTRLIAAADGNWRAAWFFVAGAAVIAGIVSLLFVRNRPSDCGQHPDGRSGDTHARPQDTEELGKRENVVHRTTAVWTVAEAFKTRAMWFVILASIGFAVPVAAVLAHGIPHLRDLGHSADVAAMSLGLVALSSIIGKLGAGVLGDRFDPRIVWAGAISLAAMGVFVVIDARNDTQLYLFAVLLGIGYGASMICWPTIVANYFGAQSFASVLGAQMPFNTAMASAAPLLAGMVFDAQGAYANAFAGIAAFSVFTAVLLLVAKPPKHRTELVDHQVALAPSKPA